MAATGPHDRRDDEHAGDRGAPRAGRRHPHARADQTVWSPRGGSWHRPRRARGRDLRAHRAGRRGKDLDVPDPRRRDGGDVRHRRAARPAGATGARVRGLPHAGLQPLPGPQRGGEPALRRRAAARARPGDRAARAAVSHDVRHGALHGPARRPAQRRHEAEARAGLRAGGRAANIIVGRADDRRRPGVASRVLGRARAALDAGDDDSPRDAVSRRGGALPPRGAHARRAPAPDRHAGRAAPEPRATAPGGARDRSAPGGGRAGRARWDRRRPALRRPARRAGARGDVRRTRGS